MCKGECDTFFNEYTEKIIGLVRVLRRQMNLSLGLGDVLKFYTGK